MDTWQARMAQRARERMKRTLRKIQRQLGGAKPEPCEPGCECGGPGSRRAISNAHARALTDNQYEV